MPGFHKRVTYWLMHPTEIATGHLGIFFLIWKCAINQSGFKSSLRSQANTSGHICTDNCSHSETILLKKYFQSQWSFFYPFPPGAFCQKCFFLDILVVFRLDFGQISFNLVENAFTTKQLTFLATSIAFYHIVTWACAEIKTLSDLRL